MKMVRTTCFSFAFAKFFTLWREQFRGSVGDSEPMQAKVTVEKNTKSGGSDPTFSAFSRPKSSWGRSRPAAR